MGSKITQDITLYMVKWIGLVLMTPKTCDNHGQRDKLTEYITSVKGDQNA